MGQLESINPFAKISKVLAGTPSPPPTPTPSPRPTAKAMPGDIDLPAEKKAPISAVDASGRRADREPETKKKPTVSRSMSKR